MRSASLAPVATPLLNPISLQVFDDMFFRLPFPDIQRMDKLLEIKNVVGEIAEFLRDMRSDFQDPRIMSDFRDGWLGYLQTEMGVDIHHCGGGTRSQLRMRKRQSPTPEDLERARQKEEDEENH
jgi:hypothetical protein